MKLSFGFSVFFAKCLVLNHGSEPSGATRGEQRRERSPDANEDKEAVLYAFGSFEEGPKSKFASPSENTSCGPGNGPRCDEN